MTSATRLDDHGAIAYVALTYAISWSLFGLWTTVSESAPLLATLLLIGGGSGRWQRR